MIYIIIAFFLLLFAIKFDVNNYKVNNSLIFFWWLIFVLLAGLRYRVGGDTFSYMISYEKIPVISQMSYDKLISNSYQPFWVLLCSLCKSVSKDFTFFQFIHAIITNSIIFYFIKKNTKYFFTGILFYFIFYYLYFNTEILRESLAICIFLLSLKYYFSNKWLIYYLLSLMAFMFHLSAVILFFLPLFKNLWTSRSYLISFIVILVMFILFKNYVLENILYLIPHEGIKARASLYLESKANIHGIIYTSVSYILIPSLLLYISEQFVGYKSLFKPFLYLYVFIGLISIFLGPFYRFINYLTPMYYLFLANMIHELFRYYRVRKFRYTLVLLIFLLPLSVHMLTIGKSTSDKVPGTRFYSRWYPYYSILTKKIDIKREKLIKIYIKENGLDYIKK